jgi:hypothetical protein
MIVSRGAYERFVAKLDAGAAVPSYFEFVAEKVLIGVTFLIVFGLFCALPRCASAADTVTLDDRRVLTIGAADGEVFEVAGRPDRIVTLYTPQGGATGERWDYYRTGKTISFYITGGRVWRIDERRSSR